MNDKWWHELIFWLFWGTVLIGVIMLIVWIDG
jgi:hypothetical protein